MTIQQLVAEPEAGSWAGGLTDSVRRTRRIWFDAPAEPVLFLAAPRPFTSPVRSREAHWLADVQDEMCSYLELGSNWDSYGGGPVSVRILHEAMMVAELMAICGFSRPQVCPESSGGILLEWQQSEKVLTVDFDGVEGFSFAYESPGEPESEGNFEDFVSLLNADLQPF